VNASHAWQLVLYVVLPYVSLTVFLLGHVWRYRSDQFGWTSRSTELYEKKMLLLGSPIFHYGTLMAIAGHALGLLIPASWTQAIGLSETPYTYLSMVAGSTAGVLVVIGLLVLTFRRTARERVRQETTAVDLAAFTTLWVMILLGTYLTIGYNILGPGYNYRPTISLWMRGIFGFQPDVSHMSGVPLAYQIHVSLAWVYLALFPFTRFVHFWSVPVWYLTRPFVVYRRRRREALLSPGESTDWRTFGGRRDRA
jgi:nitrate reductase gamma subunit